MKLYVNFCERKPFEEYLRDYSYLDVSVFIHYLPSEQNQLSPVNILVLQEPNEYFNHSDWVINNHHLFSLILTWDEYILKRCPNSELLLFGSTWFLPEQYFKPHEKRFEVAHLRGRLLKTYGHSLRWELMHRKNEIKIPINFYEIYGDRYKIEDARMGKEFVFGNSMYGIAIENTQHNNYFTEKILDIFLLKSIPIYWGCSNIEKFFNPEGILFFRSVDECIDMINGLSPEFFYSKKDVIEENFNLSLKYVNFEKNTCLRIIDFLKKIFNL